MDKEDSAGPIFEYLARDGCTVPFTKVRIVASSTFCANATGARPATVKKIANIGDLKFIIFNNNIVNVFQRIDACKYI